MNQIKPSCSNLIALSACLFFSEDALNAAITVVLSRFGLNESTTVSTVLTILVIYIPLVTACIASRRSLPIDFWILLGTAALLFFLAYDSNPQNAYFFTRNIYGIDRVFRPDRALYAYLFVRLFEGDPTGLWITLRQASVILFIYWSLVMFNALRRGYWEDYDENGRLIRMSYNLTFGYSMLMPIVVFYLEHRRNKNFIYLTLSIAALIEVLLAGSRGPMICVGVLFVIELARNVRYAWVWVLLFICVFLALLVSIIGLDTLLISLQEFLHSIGVSSRSLNRLISGTIADENGRDIIWDAAVRAIRRAPLFGYGVYGDRPLLYRYHFAGYPHNVLLEIALQFGLPIAIVSIVAILLLSIKFIFFNSSNEWSLIYTTFFVVSSQLILSMSYWYVFAFWGLLATAVNIIRNRKIEKKLELFERGESLVGTN